MHPSHARKKRKKVTLPRFPSSAALSDADRFARGMTLEGGQQRPSRAKRTVH